MTGGDWDDREIRIFSRRLSVFKTEGLAEDESERLAQQMLYRDRPDSGDDRRVCFECRHLNGIKCRAGKYVLRFVLQRCEGFEIRGIK